MSTCKIKASASFIMYLIWKDIYSHYIKFFKERKKKSVCKFRLTLQQFVEREIQCFSRRELEFAGIPQFSRADMDIMFPCFPTLTPAVLSSVHWVEMAYLPSHSVLLPVGPQTFTDPPGHLQMPACSIHIGGFTSAASQQETILYGEQLVGLGSRATLHKLDTVIFAHKSASDPPALSGSSVLPL